MPKGGDSLSSLFSKLFCGPFPAGWQLKPQLTLQVHGVLDQPAPHGLKQELCDLRHGWDSVRQCLMLPTRYLASKPCVCCGRRHAEPT